VKALSLHNNTTAIPLKEASVSYGSLYVAQLKGRTLPVASARFAQQIVEVLETEWG
jgi:hypothetical protein